MSVQYQIFFWEDHHSGLPLPPVLHLRACLREFVSVLVCYGSRVILQQQMSMLVCTSTSTQYDLLAYKFTIGVSLVLSEVIECLWARRMNGMLRLLLFFCQAQVVR